MSDSNGIVVWFVGDLRAASRTIMVCILAPAEDTGKAGENTREHAAYNPCYTVRLLSVYLHQDVLMS